MILNQFQISGWLCSVHGVTNRFMSTLFMMTCFAWLTLCLSPSISATEVSTQEKLKEEESEVAIPFGSITVRASAVEKRIEEIRDNLSDATFEREINEEFAQIKSEAEKAEQQLDSKLALRHTASELQALRVSWENFAERFGAATKKLEARIFQVEAQLEMHVEQKKIWQLTRREAKKSSTPVAIRSRVKEILDALQLLTGELTKSRSRILELQNQISKTDDNVSKSLKRIDMAKKKLGSALFERQEPILLNDAWPKSEDLGEILNRVENRLIGLLEELAAYVMVYIDRLVIQIVLVVFLGWYLPRKRLEFTQGVGHQSPQQDDSGRGGVTEEVLKYPWAIALLFGLLLTPFLYPGRPLGLRLVLAFFALPVWLTVVQGILPAVLRSALVAVASLALLETCRLLLGGFGPFLRWMLFLELAVGLVVALRVRQLEQHNQFTLTFSHGFWFSVFKKWLNLSILALCIGLFAVFFGYSNIAEQVPMVVIWGTVAGAAFVVIVRVAEVVFQSMVDSGRFDRFQFDEASRQPFMGLIRRILRIGAFFAWLYLILRSVQLLDPLLEVVGYVLTARLGYGGLTVSLGGILNFVFTLWLSWVLARFVCFTLEKNIFPRVRMASGVPFAISTFSRYTILVIGFLAAMGMLGVPLDRVTLLLSALGVGIGFGLQNITNNFVSGIILLFERPIRVGDKVQLEELIGIVSSIGIRASKIRDFDGAYVIVPNGDFMSARVINWTFADKKRRIILPVGVAYGTNPKQVLRILEEVAHAHPEVLGDPECELLFRKFGDSSLDFELRAWTESDRGWMAVMSDLAVAINDAFKAASIEIPFPQRDLHFQNITELGHALSDVVPREKPSGSSNK